MKTSSFSPICLLFILCVLFAQKQVQAQEFNELVIFGDSLSDTGNLSSVTTSFPFPFYQNRISNGPVVVDFLASELGLNAQASRHLSSVAGGSNFAIAGGNVVGNDVEDLSSQVSAYLQRSQAQANSYALFFVMIGGNDLRDIRSISSSSAADNRINEVRDTLLFELERLYNAGARTFMVANVANIGRLPETIVRLQEDSNIVARAENYVRRYNSQLSLALDEFSAQPGVSIKEFDLFVELETLVMNSAALGFTQTEVGCFTLDGFSFQDDCVFGTRFDRFVFFDSLHPSAKTNSIVGETLPRYIPDAASGTTRGNKIIISPILLLLLSE